MTDLDFRLDEDASAADMEVVEQALDDHNGAVLPFEAIPVRLAFRSVEGKARRHGCIGSCLSRHSFQAPEFHRSLGYDVFGTIDDYPRGHAMHFLSRRFADSPDG